MPRVDLVVRSKVSASMRARQLEGMFDVPRADAVTLDWHGDVPLEDAPWAVGLIVGPSGSGKTQVARELFGGAVDVPLSWNASGVIDDFGKQFSMDAVSQVCQAVGFNTIPAWLRPYHVLSRGEQFRVELARRLLELSDPIVVDEFSSVVDRQVAKIAAHAVQKWIRRHNRQFVAVSCHEDIVEWLQPDWVLEPATMRFTRRSLSRRPELPIHISRVPYAAWSRFAPFHYLTASLVPQARCYGLWCDGTLAAFAAVLHRPHPRVHDIMGFTRTVTLPDWQGLGLSPRIHDVIGSAYTALGWRLHTYPSHPHFIRIMDRSPNWACVRKPGLLANSTLATSRTLSKRTGFGGRPCAVFCYVGPPMPRDDAMRVLGDVKPATTMRVGMSNKPWRPGVTNAVRRMRASRKTHA